MPTPFSSLAAFQELLDSAPAQHSDAMAAAQKRNGQLTKPPGALGRLEDLAIWYAGWRGTAKPEIVAPQVVVFAGNHGVTVRGISAFPSEVTAQMVQNFEHGGAAINQLAACFGARIDVHALSLETPTADFTTAPAMNDVEFLKALEVGWQSVDADSDILICGEMGIGNTTSAAAIALALFGGQASDWVGRGTGVDDAGLANKARVVEEGVALHGHSGQCGLDVLRCLGGRELVAIAGAIAHARMLRIPVLLDGFICTAAAACLDQPRRGALDHCIAGHVSVEPGHARLLNALEKVPLLSLGMRLGEGSGAALALGVLKGAVACHSGMSSFAEAGVSKA